MSDGSYYMDSRHDEKYFPLPFTHFLFLNFRRLQSLCFTLELSFDKKNKKQKTKQKKNKTTEQTNQSK